MSRRWLPVVVVGIAAAVIVALFSPLASSHPDGLERVAEDKEFINTAEDPPYEIIPDYTFPGVDNEDLATILSGLVGIGIVAALGFGLAFIFRPTSRGGSSTASGGSGSQPGQR
jgi:hypothetical protein